MLSNLPGLVALSICSEIFARWYRQPVPIFSIPGIIPLVPGLPLYRAMNYTMLNAYSMGMHTFVSAALDATAIAWGSSWFPVWPRCTRPVRRWSGTNGRGNVEETGKFGYNTGREL